MRRPTAALLGTLVGTVLVVGTKYATAAPRAGTADSTAVDDAGTADLTGGTPDAPPAAGTGTSPAPGPTRSGTAAPKPGASTPGRTTGPTTAAPPAGNTATCVTAAGGAGTIASPGTGAVTVTIQVCAGVLKTATSTQSRSNWKANASALPAMNGLAVNNYKTNFAAIHYSGATLTSRAYQASLRSAMTKAGL